MDTFYDYKKFAILYVDDEERSLKAFSRALEDRFWILTASSAAEGFRVLEANADRIGVLITDQRMPGEKGVQLLERARRLRPRMLRILATAYSDIDAAVEAVNTGAIYKYLSKPWDPLQLEVTLRRALEFFCVQRERDQLLREKVSVIQQLLITDRVLGLGVVAAGLGHHVRNSLTAVRTFLDLAPSKLREEQVDLDQLRNQNFWRDFYEHVQHQVKRISELLTQLESVTEKAPLLYSDQVSLREAWEEAIGRRAGELAAQGVRVRLEAAEDLPRIKVDGARFARLLDLMIADELINLPKGGEVGVGLTATELPGGVPGVLIRVLDNGPGMPLDSLRSVFDPFFLRGNDPTEFGLNLLACYFIVYHHGGTIQVRANPEGGTEFQIRLPASPSQLSVRQDEREFLAKVLMNDSLWERLLSDG